MKKIIIETACLIGGVHAEVGEAVTVDSDTAAMLVRHGRAKFPEQTKAEAAAAEKAKAAAE